MKHENYRQLVNIFIAAHEGDFRQWLKDNATVNVDDFIVKQRNRNKRYVTDLAIYLDLSPNQLVTRAKNACSK